MARWAATREPCSSVSTVTPPNPAWTKTRTRAKLAPPTSHLSRRYANQAAQQVANTKGPTKTEATSLWLYSMIASVLKGGTTLPWQSGQSGQPRPDPVTLTTPPSTTKARTAATVVRQRTRNHWLGLLDWEKGLPDSATAIRPHRKVS